MGNAVKRMRGSSPRTWGTHNDCCVYLMDGRFIPTYMGNAYPGLPGRDDRPVHPHVHGERRIVDHIERDSTGSSPRTWGTRPYTA